MIKLSLKKILVVFIKLTHCGDFFQVRQMVVAAFLESNMQVSEETIEIIVDKARIIQIKDCFLNPSIRSFTLSKVYLSLLRHL